MGAPIVRLGTKCLEVSLHVGYSLGVYVPIHDIYKVSCRDKGVEESAMARARHVMWGLEPGNGGKDLPMCSQSQPASSIRRHSSVNLDKSDYLG
jgi:hypothetical protein